MAYSVFLKRSAEKELIHLPETVHDKVVTKLISLKDNPRPVGARKLEGREGYRPRVGNYRILYLVDDAAKRVDVVSIAHRRDVYR